MLQETQMKKGEEHLPDFSSSQSELAIILAKISPLHFSEWITDQISDLFLE